MGKKMLTIYLVTIIVVSIIFGLALDFFYASFDLQVAYGPHARGIFPYAFKVVCAIVLILVVLLSAFIKWMKSRTKIGGKAMTFYVPGMTCENCSIKIEKEIRKIKDIDQVSIDVKKKWIQASGPVSEIRIADAIREAGYEIETEDNPENNKQN